MTDAEIDQLRRFVKTQLRLKRKSECFTDQTPLFTSGMLDEDALMRLVLELNQTFRVHYSHSGFEGKRLDTIEKIAEHVTRYRGVLPRT